MKRLNKLKKAPIEMTQLLADSEQLQRLLCIDVVDIEKEEFHKMTYQDIMEKRYISFAPTDDAIKNITDSLGRNTFLIIVPTFFSKNGELSGLIYIGTNHNHQMVSNNRFRLIELVDEIIKCLDNKKVSSAGTIHIENASSVVYSQFTFGYKIEFNIHDLADVEYPDF